MKYIFLLLLFFNLTANAQHSSLDSLELVLEGPVSDSVKIHTLYWMNRYHRDHDAVDLALEKGYEMLAVSERGDDQKQITWSKRVVAHNLDLLDRKEESLKLINDYLLTLETKDTADKALLYQDLGRKYSNEENFSEALKYYFKSAHFYEQMGENLWITKAIASAYSDLNDETSASKYNRKFIAKAEEDSNYLALASGYLAEGYYNLMLIKHAVSYHYSQKAKDVYLNVLKTPEDRGLGVVYGNIADVYIYYYKNAPDSVLVINPSFSELKDIKQGMIDTAKFYIDKSYAIAKKT